jgi:hypothetical protein
MQTVRAVKGRHSLHECTTPDAFFERFRSESGESVHELVGRFVVAERIAATILGGSLSLGIGTAVSDVDLLVLIDGADALKSSDSESLHFELRGESVGEAETLLAAEVVTIVNGIEVNLQFIEMSRVRMLAEKLARPNLWLSPGGTNTVILGRIKSGWVLTSSDRFRDGCAALLKTQALEIHCTVAHLVAALQDFEDARAAVPNDLPVALHLGRAAVESCFFAYFASESHVFVGSKWLRLIDRKRAASGADRDARWALGELGQSGVSLLFPPLLREAAEVDAYLERVADFIAGVRSTIERRTAFKVAFKLCPQMHDPRLTAQSVPTSTS